MTKKSNPGSLSAEAHPRALGGGGSRDELLSETPGVYNCQAGKTSHAAETMAKGRRRPVVPVPTDLNDISSDISSC